MRRLTASIGDALADARLTGLGAADVQAVLNAQFDALWGADAQRRA
jgi:hypothetical protein